MTKIIGFLVTKEKKELDIDFFESGLTTIKLFHSGYYVYLWGIGDIETYKVDDKYSLSFPLHSSLLDRNILISFDDSSITVQNDWLGSIPVFYNQKELIVSIPIPYIKFKCLDFSSNFFAIISPSSIPKLMFSSIILDRDLISLMVILKPWPASG